MYAIKLCTCEVIMEQEKCTKHTHPSFGSTFKEWEAYL